MNGVRPAVAELTSLNGAEVAAEATTGRRWDNGVWKVKVTIRGKAKLDGLRDLEFQGEVWVPAKQQGRKSYTRKVTGGGRSVAVPPGVLLCRCQKCRTKLVHPDSADWYLALPAADKLNLSVAQGTATGPYVCAACAGE